jgi:2-iminobutanoate/2-iminopropanoate deaminase
MEFIQTLEAPQAIGPYSQAVSINGILYTSGQIALTPEGEFLNEDVTVQAEQVLTNLGKVLEAGGSSFSSVVKTTIFLADMNDFATVNEIYSKYFGDHKPARSTVAVKTLPKNALVEIEAIAVTQK